MNNLLTLPIEILDNIFSYCNIRDICMVKRTCRFLRSIVQSLLNSGGSLIAKYNTPLVTNLIKDEIKKRSFYLLLQEKYRVSHNWIIGKYSEKYVEYVWNTPCIFLDNKYLWISQGKLLRRCKRNNKNSCEILVGNQSNADICKFVLTDKFILAGLRDGTLWLKQNNSKQNHVTKIFNAHSSDVHGVSLGENIFASGSRDRTVKIWPVNQYRQRNINPCNVLNMNDRVWSIKFNSKCDLLAVGTGGHHQQTPFLVHSIESNRQILTSNMKPTSVLDIHWEDEHCVLTGGHDSCLRLWDLRVGNCVCAWDEPHDSTLYCIQTDNLYTLMCGTQNHGKVTLWDKRKTKYVQMYYMQNCKKQSSPVFSLDFDSCYLYAALDHSINILEFYSKNNKIRNYANIFIN